ncbi:MAG: nitrile hydratase subunit beta [Burkholderiales bacterium]
MNGVHDMGGMHGMGPVQIERDEPVFHEAWEKRVFAMRLACIFHRKWNGNMNRYAVERMPPADYLAATYYERVLFGLQTLLVEQGLVSASEVASGKAEAKAQVNAVLATSGIETLLRNRIRARRDEDVPPKFKSGDRIVARNMHPASHTRLPRYARGRAGVIERDYGVYVFPDTSAMTGDPKPQHLYDVRFSARELWGPDASARDSVHMSLWDDHLAPA